MLNLISLFLFLNIAFREICEVSLSLKGKLEQTESQLWLSSSMIRQSGDAQAALREFITLIDDLHTVETEMDQTQPLAVSSRLVLISVSLLWSKSLKWAQQRAGHGGAAGADGESKLDVTLVLCHPRNKSVHQSPRASGQFERADVLPGQHCDQRSHLARASGCSGERRCFNSSPMTGATTLSKLPARKAACFHGHNEYPMGSISPPSSRLPGLLGFCCIAPLFLIQHTDVPD